MSATEVLEDLFFFERGYLNANHLAWRGERPVLIDTGYVTHFPDTAGRLERLGVNLDRVSLIVTTHAHCDHVGGHRPIQERSGCRVAMHPLGRQFVTSRDDWSTWWRYYGLQAEFFACDRALADGETVRVGPHAFMVIHTPGHAADGLVLYHEAAKLLISSDTLWGEGLAVVTERVEGNAAVFRWLEALERLKTLDVDLVLPGHGPAFTDFSGALHRTAKRLKRYMTDRREIGRDQLKRMLIYTLLMSGPMEDDDLFRQVMGLPWFPETCRHYFDGDERRVFGKALGALEARKAVARTDAGLAARVPA